MGVKKKSSSNVSKGKVIEIHLIDGKPSGLRTVKILGKTIQTFACSRYEISKLTEREEITKPGIYFLIGKTDMDDVFYIGETENFTNRIKGHFKKEFWNQVVLFNSSDKKLNKAYVKYLETQIIRNLIDASQVKIENINIPKEPSLSDAEIDYLDQFIEDLFLILGNLGYPEVNKKARTLEEQETKLSEWKPESIEDFVFVLKRRNEVIAQMTVTPHGYMLLKQSVILEATQSFLSDPGRRASRNKRAELVADGSIIKEDDYRVLKRDVLLNSPSKAAEVVLGWSANGRKEWKTPEGKTYAEIETEFLDTNV